MIFPAQLNKGGHHYIGDGELVRGGKTKEG